MKNKKSIALAQSIALGAGEQHIPLDDELPRRNHLCQRKKRQR